MAPGAIPLSEIRSYAETIGYPEVGYFVSVIARIDWHILERQSRESK